MLAFEDATASFDEPKSARLEARTKPSVKDAINQAAMLNGTDVSAFVVNAAYKAALATIEGYKITVLSEADRKAIFDALENPSRPTKRLKEAFALHKKLIANDD